MKSFERTEGNLYVMQSRGQRPLSPQSPEKQAQGCYELGLSAEDMGDTRSAFVYYKEAVKVDPNAISAWVNMGTIHLGRGNFKAAEKCYRKAINICPEYAMAHYNLVLIFQNGCDKEAALECYQKALHLKPTYPDPHFNIGLLYSETEGRQVKAINHFRAFLKYGSGEYYLDAATLQIKRLKAQLRQRFSVIPKPSAAETAELASDAG